MSKGTLYVVSTPIGNLEDITLRALRILKEVDIILCEDKRITSRLLNRHKIKSNLIAFHKYNEEKLINYVMSTLVAGKNIAIVSDAGTPLISDPGLSLISYLRESDINIVSIPGPSALTGALSICNLDSKEFLFIGFLPEKRTEREKLISSFSSRANMVTLFIAPHDLSKYLKEISNFYPSIQIFYVRELTKLYEESWTGNIKDLIKRIENKKIKGEIVLCLSFKSIKDKKTNFENKEKMVETIKDYISSGYSLKEASKLMAKQINLSSKDLYNLYIKTKKPEN